MNHQPSSQGTAPTNIGLLRHLCPNGFHLKHSGVSKLYFKPDIPTPHPEALLNQTTAIVNHHQTQSDYSDCESGHMSMKLQ